VSVPVRIDQLCVALGGRTILDHVDLDVPAGSFVTLLGPSGSGKTTTLNVLAGFLDADSGSVRLGDTPINTLAPHQRGIGVVFQNYALFPHLSVTDNVAFPLRARKVASAERRRKVAEALALVHLPDVGDRPVHSLSGGQQQRIALARALVFSPSLLLLDEPLAALDKQLRETMQLELKRIQAESGVTTIAVTHDQVEALSMSDLVAIMEDGRIAQVGSPEDVYRRPASRFVAQFLGEANLVPVRDGEVAALRTRTTSGARDGMAVVRPEDLCLQMTADPNSVRATVRDVTFQGSRVRVTTEVAGCDQQVIVSVAPHELPGLPAPGEELHVRHRGTAVHALPMPSAAHVREPVA
jgi:putative spermidine/putrescine transport system ATP-binding protein